MLKWLVCIVVGCVALIALLLATGFGYELISAARDARRFDPPGERVDVGGYRSTNRAFIEPIVRACAGKTGNAEREYATLARFTRQTQAPGRKSARLRARLAKVPIDRTPAT